MRFATESWPFVLPFVALAAILAAVGKGGAAAAALLLALAVLLFFRIPRRRFEGQPRMILAAADGLVTRIEEAEEPLMAAGPHRRIVTFLSVFDVHVQRSPVSGEVVLSRYTPGRKRAAFLDSAGEVNESHLLVIQRPDGSQVGVKQIAGLLARRIVSYPQVGERLERGQLIGLIKFGSRVDLILPVSERVLAVRGSRVKTGLTPVAEAAAWR
jgi:phosphatidylserine decarboxylase